MTRTSSLLIASAVLTLTAACAPNAATPTDTTADVAALKKMQDRELATLASGSVDTMMTNYTADIVFMPPDEPMVTGAAGARAWLEAFLKDATPSGKYTNAEVEVMGNTGIVRYAGVLTVTPKKGGKPTTAVIKGLHVFKKQADGSWKIAQDVWNNDPPPAPAKK